MIVSHHFDYKCDKNAKHCATNKMKLKMLFQIKFRKYPLPMKKSPRPSREKSPNSRIRREQMLEQYTRAESNISFLIFANTRHFSLFSLDAKSAAFVDKNVVADKNGRVG